jgi:glycosyltransferase involved in cell wall biosynthesis
MKGVMMLVNYFPPLPTGGAERQAERLAGYLVAKNVHTGVITRRVGALARVEERDGFEIHRIMQVGPGKMKTITFTIAAIIFLIRFRNTYDILHAHLAFSPAIAAAVAGKILGKSVIVKFGNSDSFGDIQRSQKTLRGRIRLAILRRWVDVCIALDADMEKEILAAGFARDHVIRMDNGIDTTKFKPGVDKLLARKSLNLGLENKVLILYSGRMVPQKALPLLIKAVQQAVKSCQDLHLLMVGSGEDRASLIALTDELGLAHCVTFIDQVSDVKPYLHAAELFALPSLAEGISNSLLEAMSCGLACIATSVGGSPEVLEGGKVGMLVAPQNVEELTAALVCLGQSEEKRMRLGVLARQRVLEKYDFQVVGEKYFGLYNRLLEAQ